MRERIEQKRPYHRASDEDDVVLLVRQYMADKELSQDPLLVLPGVLRPRVDECFCQMNVPKPVIERRNKKPGRSTELVKLAGFLEDNFGHIYQRAAAYIREIALSPGYIAPPVLEFLKHGRQSSRGRVLWQGQPDENIVPHRMCVHFPPKRNYEAIA